MAPNFFIIEKDPKNIGEIFCRCFECWKHLSHRLEYSLECYQNHCIKWNFHTLKRTIHMTTRAWIIIISLLWIIIWPHDRLFMNVENFDEISQIKRSDLVIIELIIIFIVLEWMWFHIFKGIWIYRSSWNDFIVINYRFDDHQLRQDFHEYLTNFYVITHSIAKLLYAISAVTLIIFNILFIHLSIGFYLNFKITLIQLMMTMSVLSMLVHHLILMMGQLFLSLNYTIFVVEFLKIRLKQLHTFLRIEFKLFRFTTVANFRKIWKKFYPNYIRIYSETIKMNQTEKIIFFNLELISKSAIIISALFIGQQLKMNIMNTFVALVFIIVFCYTTLLYSRVSYLPFYNQLCSRALMDGVARQKPIPFVLKHFYSIKSHLLIQTMANNRLGFTCGEMFFITRFKYIQLFILNFHLIIKFYKKICISS